MNLHGQIMTLRATGEPAGGSMAYKLGHRDARHAAAELALKADDVAAAARRLLDWVEHAENNSDCINWQSVNADEGAALRDALAVFDAA